MSQSLSVRVCIGWGPEKDGVILSTKIDGLAALRNNGFADPKRLEKLTSAAVRESLTGAAP